MQARNYVAFHWLCVPNDWINKNQEILKYTKYRLDNQMDLSLLCDDILPKIFWIEEALGIIWPFEWDIFGNKKKSSFLYSSI